MSQKIPTELQGVVDFLASYLPFDALAETELFAVAHALEIQYFRKGHRFSADNTEGGLRILRRGAAELRDAGQQLIERLAEGESFNLQGLLSEQTGVSVVLIEDTLLYLLPEPDYQRLRARHRPIDRFFHSQRARRVRRAARYEPVPGDLLRKVSDLMSTGLLCVSPDTSIRLAAQQMTARRVSSVLVTLEGQLLGILTDRDIRSRVVAAGVDPEQPVSAVMTAAPEGLGDSATLFDATLFMTEKGYHHVPILRDSGLGSGAVQAAPEVVGIVTASDLMLARQDDPVYLVQHILRQQHLDALQAVARQLPSLLLQWVNAGVRPYQISRILTAVSDAITRRLIELAIAELGPAPVAFCWLGFGSQGRAEQLLGADQDNGLLIDDAMRPEHSDWFRALAQRVCDGLQACGYPYCHGGIMATTDSWRLPLQGWMRTVDQWVRTPTRDAVMRVSIFFDLRSIYGDAALCRTLQQHMLKVSAASSIFLAALAENVLDAPPPLGIFRRFVVERNGEHRDQLNLKLRGITPIVDCARIHCLAHNLTAVNTLERLQSLARHKAIAIADSRNLQDAWSVIMQIRIQQQAKQVSAAEPVSNYLNPDTLSQLERQQLRDAFAVVGDAHTAIKMTYRPGLG